jgi:hypothetical protein
VSGEVHGTKESEAAATSLRLERRRPRRVSNTAL